LVVVEHQHLLQVTFIVQTDQILVFILHHLFPQYGLMVVQVQEHSKDPHRMLWQEEVMVTHLVLAQVEQELILGLADPVEHLVMLVVVTEVPVKVMIRLHVAVAVVLVVLVEMVQQVQEVVLAEQDNQPH
jgi:hypothetical protein